MYRLILSRQANDFLEELTGKHKLQVENALGVLTNDPHQGKMLKGELRGYWSFRVGMYRVLYTIEAKQVLVEVLRIQHRKEVYEKFKR